MKESKVLFDAKKLAAEMMKNLSEEQTRRLIEYAKKEIVKLGNMIASYNGANGLDRTGNLLNSLCWGVTYNGEVKDSGFYREPKVGSRTNRWGQERGMGIKGGNDSYLHEFFPNDMEPVYGRQFAEEYLNNVSGKSGKWTVFFAILAPYWGYWESGFTMRGGGGDSGAPRHSRFMQFQVMTHIFDDVRIELKPAKTHLTVYVPKYSYKARSHKGRKYKNKVGVKKIGIIR